MRTVKEIIIDYCQSIRADGLGDPVGNCGCRLNEICLCDMDFGDCKPARLTKCIDCELIDE